MEKTSNRNKTKVLMVLGSTAMGGTQAFLLNILRNIDLDRFQVDLAVNRDIKDGGISEEVREMGCNIYFWPPFKVYNYAQFVRFWRSFLSNHHYDIVHGHSTNSAAVYLKVAKNMGCVTVAHSHSAGFRGNKFQQLIKSFYAKRVGKVADYWFACSRKAAERLFGNAYRTYPDYYDIPNAINAENYLYDVNKANEIRTHLGISEDEFLCGHVGSFSAPKNHSFLLDIFCEVLKIRPNARLVCCGTGALLPQIKTQAAALGISDKISFPGVVKNCNEYMMAMDTLVFPSLFEGFPITILEAEATGLPVVMSDVITHEVDLTKLIHRQSLEDSPLEWAKTICNIDQLDRPSQNHFISETNYNMRTSIMTITDLYERMLKLTK